MKRIILFTVLLSLMAAGCSEKEQTLNQTFELRAASRSVDGTTRITLHIDLYTEGDRTVRVDEGQSGHTQIGVSGSSTGVDIPGTAQVNLTAKLTADNGSSVFVKQTEIKTNGGRAGGSSSGTVDSDLKLADLASFAIKTGNYAYGEEIELGIVEGDKWVLTVE